MYSLHIGIHNSGWCGQTAKLQQENAVLAARMAELEGANRSLAREAYGWRTRYEQLVGPSQQQAQPGAQPRLQGLFPTPTPSAEKRVRANALVSRAPCKDSPMRICRRGV